MKPKKFLLILLIFMLLLGPIGWQEKDETSRAEIKSTIKDFISIIKQPGDNKELLDEIIGNKIEINNQTSFARTYAKEEFVEEGLPTLKSKLEKFKIKDKTITINGDLAVMTGRMLPDFESVHYKEPADVLKKTILFKKNKKFHPFVKTLNEAENAEELKDKLDSAFVNKPDITLITKDNNIKSYNKKDLIKHLSTHKYYSSAIICYDILDYSLDTNDKKSIITENHFFVDDKDMFIMKELVKSKKRFKIKKMIIQISEKEFNYAKGPYFSTNIEIGLIKEENRWLIDRCLIKESKKEADYLISVFTDAVHERTRKGIKAFFPKTKIFFVNDKGLIKCSKSEFVELLPATRLWLNNPQGFVSSSEGSFFISKKRASEYDSINFYSEDNSMGVVFKVNYSRADCEWKIDNIKIIVL